MKLNTKLLTISALFIAALMLLSPISQINTSGGGGTNNYDLDFLNSLDINNNNFVLSADSSSNSVNIKDVKVVDKEDGTKELQYNNEEVDSKTTFISVKDEQGLNKLSTLVNDDGFNFSGYTIKLTKNLILDDPDPNQNEQSNFTPIGKDSTHTFNGTFDGQGNTISNLQVSDVEYAGLFGRLDSGATVKNLGITNSEISTTSTNNFAYSGGITGYNDNGTITNCYNTGNVSVDATNTGMSFSGGIAGSNYDGTITNCYNTGTVTASSNSGGIAGYNSGTIKNCYNSGAVSAKSTYFDANSGGIVGWIFGGTITNCYNAGDVTADSTNSDAYSGGIAGENGIAIQSCYYIQGIDPVGHGNGTILDCKPFDEEGLLSGGNSSLLDALNGWVKDANVGNTNDYRYWMGPFIKNEKHPVFTDWYGEAERLNKEYPNDSKYKLPDLNDKGVYEIENGYQLALIAANDNLNGDYVLSGDIDLSGYEWRPIGKDRLNRFSGTFDGQGHAIFNLQVSDVEYAGLFGYLGSNATVKNLGIINSEISVDSNGIAYSGGITGYNDNGTITNCYNTGNVIATSTSGNAYSGGIAGYNYGGTITNCYNTGTVIATSTSGNAYSGGIAGWNYQGTITNCYNNGTVTGTANYSGGITGYNDNGTITNCYNTGDVTGSSNSGGIAGSNEGTITNCYNTGVVAEAKLSGGIAGDNYEGTITNCYNAGDVEATTNYEAFSGGIAGYQSTFTTNEGTITNCYNTGTVNAKSTNYNANSGGIIGENGEGTITNCYNTGDVTATATNNDAFSGGIVGNNGGPITNCYNTGDVTATAKSTNYNANSGGIVGSTNGEIKNCYYLNGCVSNGKGGGKELDQDAMTGSNLLGVGSDNNLNKDEKDTGITDPNSKPWSPDIFGVNDDYPILADVPTQLDPKNSANKPPQSAVYITLDAETDQVKNYLTPIIKTDGKSVKATANNLEIKTTPSPLITSYKWHMMEGISKVETGQSCDLYYGTYYVKVTSSDGYSYTSLTRTMLNTFTVTFDSKGGSDVGSIEVDGGKTIDEPEAPTKDNYVFAGWYTDEEFTSKYDFKNTPVTKNITLYAKWGAKAEVTVKLGDTTWETFEGAVYLYQEYKEKYTLNGSEGVYSADVDLGKYQIYVKMGSTDIGDPVDTNESINLTNGNNSAEVQYWTVTFDYKDDDETDPLEKIVLNNSSVTGPTSPTRTGYTFEGWYTSADDEWNFSLDKVKSDMTLYAKWKEIEYTVKYHANGSTSGTVPSDPLTYKINNQIILNSDGGTLAKSGHIFRGWNYTPNASSALPSSITLSEHVIENYINTVSDDNTTLTLYAVWTPIPEPIYTLCLNSNDSTLQTKRYSGTYGTEVTLKSASDFGWNNECKFIEWNSKSDGSGVSYKEGDKFSLGSEVWNLYAIWSDSSYHTVSFDSNGGNSIPSQSVQDGYRASEPNAPTKQGHSFKHWSLNGVKYDFNQSVKEDITLKAEYEIISYKVTFYYNGDVYYSTVADYNTSLGDRMPSLPSDKDKWNTSENGKGSNFNADSLITSDISVYAVSENSITSILIIGGSAAAILAAIAAWLFMRSRYN